MPNDLAAGPAIAGSAHAAAPPLDHKLATLRAVLKEIQDDFAPAAFASSFGAEDMVLTDLIAREFPGIKVFTLDTGRLPRETLDLMSAVRARYGLRVSVYTPISEIVEDFVARKGLNAFYDSVENRKSCCYIRKVEPLARALVGKKAWLTGLRREQAASRHAVAESESDEAHGNTKFNPLADWTEADVWAYLRANAVPYNKLHDRGYPSIGCEPCTRAVKPGEDPRAGRWWWENEAGQKECGLHVQSVDASAITRRNAAAPNGIAP